jgi:hypothetical protein
VPLNVNQLQWNRTLTRKSLRSVCVLNSALEAYEGVIRGLPSY